MGGNTLRLAYAPLMLVGVNGLAIWLIGDGHLIAGPLLAVPLAIGLSFAAERLIPYRPEWNRSRGDSWRDVCHALVNEGANLATLASLPLAGAWLKLFDVWPSTWPFALQVVGAILVLDAGITLTHYASHRFAWLWRFHAVHHSVRRMYGFNGLMKHPVHQSIEMLIGSTPLVLLGLPASVATALVTCTAVQLLLQHSNADYRLGPLKTVLATNEIHRFHHLRRAGEGDVNFGLFTAISDHLLGTFHWEAERRFSSDDLGVAGRADYPVSYLAQLAEPFRREPAPETTV